MKKIEKKHKTLLVNGITKIGYYEVLLHGVGIDIPEQLVRKLVVKYLGDCRYIEKDWCNDLWCVRTTEDEMENEASRSRIIEAVHNICEDLIKIKKLKNDLELVKLL